MPKQFEINQQIHTKDHGEIVLYQRPDHKIPKWQTRIKINGCKGYTRQSTKTTDIDKANLYAANLYNTLADNFRLTGSAQIVSFSDVVDEWISTLHQQNKNITTIQEFEDRLDNYPVRFWGKKPVGEIEQSDLIGFIDWRKTQGRNGTRPAAATIKKDLVPLRQVFEFAYGKKYISQRLRLPKIKVKSNRRPDFNEKEWRKIVRVLPKWVEKVTAHRRHFRDRYYLQQYILILGYSGIRAGTEARSITWKSLKKEHQHPYPDKQFRIQVIAGKKGPRMLTPDDKVEDYFRDLKKFRRRELKKKKKKLCENEPVFCHEDGKPIGSFKKGFDEFLTNYKLLKNEMGQKRSPYSMRHTYATRMILHGSPHWELAKNMGTSVEQLEKFYVHDNPALIGRVMAKYQIPERIKNDTVLATDRK